jgi:hypothetical protein
MGDSINPPHPKLSPQQLADALSAELNRLRASIRKPDEKWQELKKNALEIPPPLIRRNQPEGWDWFRFKGFRWLHARQALIDDWLRIRERYGGWWFFRR